MSDTEKRASIRSWLAKRIANVADRVEANRIAQGRSGIFHGDPSGLMRQVSDIVDPESLSLVSPVTEPLAAAGRGARRAAGAAVAPGEGAVWEGLHQRIADTPRLPLLALAIGAPALALSAQKAHEDSVLLGPLYEAEHLGETPMSQDTYYNFTQRRKYSAQQEKTASREKMAVGGFKGLRRVGEAGLGPIEDIIKRLLYKDVMKGGGQVVSELSMPRALGAAGAGLAGLTALDVMGEPVVEGLQQTIFPGYGQQQLQQRAMESFSQEAGKQTAQMAGDIVRTLGTMGMGAVQSVPVSQHQRRTFGHAMKTDPMLQQATPEEEATLERAFQSMVRFAPELATDEFAVKNYLRESLMSAAGGPDYGTLANLGRASQMLQGDRR